jgi:single-strand DNA-binding protein
VVVSGRLTQRTYETREGEKRTVIELQVDEIGPSLRYATAKVQKMSRSGGDSGGGFGASGARDSSANPEDPWANAPVPGPASGDSFDGEPAF